MTRMDWQKATDRDRGRASKQAEYADGWRPITARFAGKCGECDRRIPIGKRILFKPDVGARCVKCR